MVHCVDVFVRTCTCTFVENAEMLILNDLITRYNIDIPIPIYRRYRYVDPSQAYIISKKARVS